MIYMLNMWDDISFNIISGIYGTVARVYDILLQVINGHQNVSYTFESFASNIYVLAGVFILFRVAIGMIQMIINPDQMSDKQQGAGKMIIRIVTCVIMLLVFYPGGLIFGKDGILNRLEVAIMGTGTNANGEERDGLIENIFDIDVDAAGKELNCYYYYVNKDESVNNDVTTLGGLYHVTYTLENRSGYTKMKTPIKYTGGSVYYKVDTGTMTYKNNEVKFESINGTLYDKGRYFKNSGLGKDRDNAILPSKCPKMIRENDPITGETNVTENGTIQKNTIYGGYKKFENMIKDIKINYNANDVKTDNEFLKDVANVGSGKNLINKMVYGEDSLKFSQGVAKSFQNCSIEESADMSCDDLQDGMFNDPEINDQIKNEMGNGNFTVDFLTSLIAGIGIIIYLIVLCVDVIIRQLKMLLLEMLSPIAIVSYADPKDKVFPKWTKMLVSTYLELFIKIMGIKIAAILIDAVWAAKEPFGGNLLIMFFYIVAILIFAKVVPSMISKLFGLDNMGGSFKDIVGMAKGAAGFGAGAVIGGVVGAATGKGLGRVSGLGKGMLMGAGSGSKGKIMGGANSISAQNARINDAKKNGLGFWDRTVAGMAGSVGYSSKAIMDNQIKEKVDKKGMLDGFRKHKDKIESMADSSNYMSDMKVRMERGQIGKEEYKAARSAFIKHNENAGQWMRKNSQGNVEVMNEHGEWQDTGLDKYKGNYKTAIEDANGNIIGWRDTDIKYEGSAVGKISQAEAEMRAEFNSNTFLQKELGMQGQSIANFESYEKAEAKAKDKSNQYSEEIISFQNSDPYRKAKSMDEYSKKK